MSELDLTAAESKATYAEIKQYVLDKYGLKVSSLNTAQIKAKCGIIERENYNTAKNENVKQPHQTFGGSDVDTLPIDADIPRPFSGEDYGRSSYIH